MAESPDQVEYIDTHFGETAASEFASNAEPRCPCILLLDTSHSMSGEPIRELNRGLTYFHDELMADSLAAKRVEVSVITFGPVRVQSDFQTADMFKAPTLTAQSDTPMGEAIEKAILALQQRKETYKRNGIDYFRPWIFLITDGGPTDSWQRAAQMVQAGEQSKAFSFYAVGVQGANFDILKQIAVRDPLRLDGLRFRDLFAWLSASLSAVSQSTPGDLVPLTNPTGPNGWAAAG